MATSTNIQYLVATGKDELGATVSIKTASDRRQIETFLAGAAITAGDWVMFDTAATDAARVLTVVQATFVSTGQPLTVGVALNSATAAGQTVDVVVSGYVEGANVTTSVASGAALSINTTNGRGSTYAAASLAPICGVALEVAASNLADVWVIKQF